MTETACTAERFGDHDYSQPPHNTPETARNADDPPGCQHQATSSGYPCQHESRYEMVVYQPGSHEWIHMTACGPCTATLRERCQRMPLGPPGNKPGIAWIRTAAMANGNGKAHG